jgi:septum formation protein
MRIILASQSPRRKKLLKQLGFEFEVQPSSVNESSSETNPIRLVEELALRKAKDIAQKNPNSLVIGSDTIVVHDGIILGKPETNSEASNMLNKLSDAEHQVHTGVALIQTDANCQISKTVSFTDATTVFFNKLDQQEIDTYIATGSPMDKAGSYGIQDDSGAIFIKRIEGDFYNVVGLPINKVYYQLKKNFPKILEQRILKS